MKAHRHAFAAQPWFTSPGHLGRAVHDGDAWGDTDSLQCYRDALNNLVRDKGGIAAMGQLAVFQQCREKIEAIASQKWDCRQLEEDGCVTVRPEDLVKARFA